MTRVHSVASEPFVIEPEVDALTTCLEPGQGLPALRSRGGRLYTSGFVAEVEAVHLPHRMPYHHT